MNKIISTINVEIFLILDDINIPCYIIIRLGGQDMKNELSDFIKFAYKNGDVKDVKDAFDEFPPEEEWHHGRIENVIAESSVIYSDVCEIGDIVFARKYFHDNGKTGENHLFVIIDQNYYAVPIENFGMLISSNLDKLKYESNIFIKHDIKNNLDKDSIVKIDVIYKILPEQIAFKIGRVDMSKVDEYKNIYFKKKNKKD